VIALEKKGKCSIQVELTRTFKDEKVIVRKERSHGKEVEENRNQREESA